MKEAMMKVIDMLTQADFHGVFQKLLKRYNKCIAARGDYFKKDKSFICVLSIKESIRKKSGNLLKAPCNCYLVDIITKPPSKDFLNNCRLVIILATIFCLQLKNSFLWLTRCLLDITLCHMQIVVEDKKEFDFTKLKKEGILLCFDLLTRPKMPFKVMHRKEVTHSNGQ